MIDEKFVKENLKKTLTQQENLMITLTSIQTLLICKGLVSKDEVEEIQKISTDAFIDKKYETLSDKQKEILSSSVGTMLYGAAISTLGGNL